MDGDVVRDLFILMALLIAVAYFTGAATDTNALAAGFTKLIYAATGRTSTGTFAAYPSGGSQAPHAAA